MTKLTKAVIKLLHNPAIDVDQVYTDEELFFLNLNKQFKNTHPEDDNTYISVSILYLGSFKQTRFPSVLITHRNNNYIMDSIVVKLLEKNHPN